MNVVIYARYSSDKQTEQSIEGQVHVCQEYATRNGLTIIGQYVDRGLSGRTDKRDEFKRMIRESAEHKFEAVLVYKLDRFSRDKTDNAVYKSVLRKNGVKVVSATENIPDNPEGILLESLLEGLAQYYSAELAQKVKRGIRESILKGQFIGGPTPYGYDIIDKKYSVNEKEAEIVKLIYQKYLAGDSVKKISDFLNSRHVYTKKEKPFKHHQIMNILTKPIYAGSLIRNEIETTVPAIIDKELFMQVQDKVKTKTRTNAIGNFLLSGKIFCDCGKKMTGTSGTGRSKTYFYYECRTDKVKVRKEKIEDLVINTIDIFLNNVNKTNSLAGRIDDFLKENTSDSRIAELKRKLLEIEKEMENISKAIVKGIVNDSIKQKNDLLLIEQEECLKQINLIVNHPLSKLSGNEIVAFLKELGDKDETFLIKTLLHKVIIKDDTAFIVLNSRSDDNLTRDSVEIRFEKNCIGSP